MLGMELDVTCNSNQRPAGLGVAANVGTPGEPLAPPLAPGNV